MFMNRLIRATLARNVRVSSRITRFMSGSDNSGSDNIFDDDFIENRQFKDMTIEDFRILYDKNDDIKSTIEAALDEYEYTKYNSNGRVPSVITPDDMRFLLEETNSSETRQKIFYYFFKKEMDKLAYERRRKREKEETRKKIEQRIKETTETLGKHERTGLLSEEGNIIYGLWHNSLFLRLNEHSERIKYTSNNLIRSALNGRRLIFDFSYESYMKKALIKNICEQVRNAYGINRFAYDDPFDIWFCNFNTPDTSSIMEKNFLQNLNNGSMITVKEGCPTEYFDRQRLIYLSPHAKMELNQVALSDDIYIIGAFNDKGCMKPMSLKKAESMGIRAMKFPLDRHLAWKSSSKNLCVNHVTGILLELMHNGNNWKEAFEKYIPTRKLKTTEQILEEEKYRRSKLLKSFRKQKENKFDIRDNWLN